MSIVKNVITNVLSVDLTTLVVFALVLLVTYEFMKSWERRKYPPGPPRLPLVGCTPFFDLARPPWKVGKDLQKKYQADIVSIDLYGRIFVFLQTVDVIKEAFQKRDDMTDRVPQNIFHYLEPGYKGILSSSGQVWKDTRRFTLLMLRDFGMGKLTAEQYVRDEYLHLTKKIEEDGKSENGFDPLDLLAPAVSNVICSIAFGKRFDYDNHEFLDALDALNYVEQETDAAYRQIALSPKLSWLIPIFYSEQDKMMKKVYLRWGNFVRRIIQDHRDNFNNEVNDLIDAFFAEQEKRADDKDSSFTEAQLRHLIQDLFLAGTETTTSTLRWVLLHYVSKPEVAERVHEELMHVIGERAPTMDDKKNTPYTEAFLLEVQRMNTLAPIGVGHSSLNHDVQLRGYTIPANSYIFANLAAVHHDQNLFENPDEFNVERFLENGKVVNADKVAQFGIGRRVCQGETLARMELYLFFVSIVLKFNLQMVGNEFDFIGRTSTVIHSPMPYRLKAGLRE